MAEFLIEDASREQAYLRLALAAVSGGGKTMSALRLAKGLVDAMLAGGLLQGDIRGKIGLVDTERRSAQLYSHVVPFKTIPLSAPYTVDRYLGAVHCLEDYGCEVIIVDQISHAWAGKGGLLEAKDQLARTAKNDMQPWADITPIQNSFIEALLELECHLIVTMRSKGAWVMEKVTKPDGREVNKPRKVGLAPVQRPGIEFEFTTVLDLESGTNLASASKDRTELFAGVHARLDEKWGARLAQWLYQGRPGINVGPPATPAERAEATTKVLEATLLLVATLPDLEREFQAAQAAVRAMDIGGFMKKGFVDRIVKAKDERKAALGTSAAAATVKVHTGGVEAMPLDPEEVSNIESALKDAGITIEAFRQHFEVWRIVQLPPARLQEAQAWIREQAELGAQA